MRKTKGRQRGRIVQLIIALLLIVLVGIIVTRFSEHSNGQARITLSSNGLDEETGTSVAEKPTPTPKPKQGTIIVTVSEEDTGLPVAGVEVVFESMILSDLDASTTVTGADGKAASPLLDYGTSHRIALAGGPNAYNLNVTERSVSIAAPTQTADFLLSLKEHVKEIVRGEDGIVSIAKVFMSLPIIMQKPELPNGCEITSLTAVLNFYGYPAEKLDMADNYLPKEGWTRKDGKLFGADPYIAYAGNPRDQPGGFFSFAPPIVEAAETYIADNGGSQSVTDISGSTREELVAKLMEGTPIVTWTTLDLSPPKVTYSWYLHTTGELYNAPVNLHVVVLNGYDVETNTLHVMNPLVGQVTYDADKFFASYEGMGNHALIVEP